MTTAEMLFLALNHWDHCLHLKWEIMSLLQSIWAQNKIKFITEIVKNVINLETKLLCALVGTLKSGHNCQRKYVSSLRNSMLYPLTVTLYGVILESFCTLFPTSSQILSDCWNLITPSRISSLSSLIRCHCLVLNTHPLSRHVLLF